MRCSVDTKVQIVRCLDLTGSTGVVIGYYTDTATIILLDSPYNGQKGVVVTNACVEERKYED